MNVIQWAFILLLVAFVAGACFVVGFGNGHPMLI